MENQKPTPTLEQVPQMVLHLSEEFDSFKKLFLAQSNSNQPEGDQLLNITEAGELISLSVPTIYSLVSRSAIPVCKKGKRLYFSKQELLDWIKSGRRKTTKEIAEEVDNFVPKSKKVK